MVFSSETFLFLFLPLFLVLYYLTPDRFRSMTILAGSWIFYGWWRFDFLGLLILTTLWTYGIGLMIRRHLDTPRAQIWCAIGVAGCLAVLGVFKYLNFFVDSLAVLMGTDAAGLGLHWRLILPIGVSFYVFQSISYLVDVTRRDVLQDPGDGAQVSDPAVQGSGGPVYQPHPQRPDVCGRHGAVHRGTGQKGTDRGQCRTLGRSGLCHAGPVDAFGMAGLRRLHDPAIL